MLRNRRSLIMFLTLMEGRRNYSRRVISCFACINSKLNQNPSDERSLQNWKNNKHKLSLEDALRTSPQDV